MTSVMKLLGVASSVVLNLVIWGFIAVFFTVGLAAADAQADGRKQSHPESILPQEPLLTRTASLLGPASRARKLSKGPQLGNRLGVQGSDRYAAK